MLATWSDDYIAVIKKSEIPQIATLELILDNRQISQMRVPLAACRELAGCYNRLLMVLYVFQHKNAILL